MVTRFGKLLFAIFFVISATWAEFDRQDKHKFLVGLQTLALNISIGSSLEIPICSAVFDKLTTDKGNIENDSNSTSSIHETYINFTFKRVPNRGKLCEGESEIHIGDEGDQLSISQDGYLLANNSNFSTKYKRYCLVWFNDSVFARVCYPSELQIYDNYIKWFSISAIVIDIVTIILCLIYDKDSFQNRPYRKLKILIYAMFLLCLHLCLVTKKNKSLSSGVNIILFLINFFKQSSSIYILTVTCMYIYRSHKNSTQTQQTIHQYIEVIITCIIGVFLAIINLYNNMSNYTICIIICLNILIFLLIKLCGSKLKLNIPKEIQHLAMCFMWILTINAANDIYENNCSEIMLFNYIFIAILNKLQSIVLIIIVTHK